MYATFPRNKFNFFVQIFRDYTMNTNVIFIRFCVSRWYVRNAEKRIK